VGFFSSGLCGGVSCGIGEIVVPQGRNVTTTLKTIKHNIRGR